MFDDTGHTFFLKGVSVELANRSGQTPLFCAAYFGHLDIVNLLLRRGADPNRRCSIQCCTPVHAACWSGNTTLITLLLIAGMLIFTTCFKFVHGVIIF